MALHSKNPAESGKPAGISRLDPLFDGTLMDRLAVLIFGAGAATAAIGAEAGADGIILEAAAGAAADAAFGAATTGTVAAEMAVGAAVRAGEHAGGLFRGIFNFASEVAYNSLIDRLIWGSSLGYSDGSVQDVPVSGVHRKAAAGELLTPEEIKAFFNDLTSRNMQPHGAAIAESVFGTSFLRKQLETLSYDKNVSEAERGECRLLSQYFKNLGLNKLPEKDKVKTAHKLLLPYLHPDKVSSVDLALSQQLNASRDTLLSDATRKLYEEGLRKYSTKEGFLESLKQTAEHFAIADWKGAFQATINSGILLNARPDIDTEAVRDFTEAPRPDTLLGRLQQDFMQSSQTRQGAVVFGTVTGVVGATYFGTKALEEYLQLKHAKDNPDQKNNARWRNVVLYGATALGSAGLTGAALNGYRLQGGAFR